jgi:hypothetical protein
MFKNIKIGLIGSVPIIITALISFGIMGFLGIPLSTTTALLSSIAIGIGIDYAVHFLEQYRHNATNTDDKLVAAQKTMAHSGKAIIYNAIVVIAEENGMSFNKSLEAYNNLTEEANEIWAKASTSMRKWGIEMKSYDQALGASNATGGMEELNDFFIGGDNE